jgi:hypothetical protein
MISPTAMNLRSCLHLPVLLAYYFPAAGSTVTSSFEKVTKKVESDSETIHKNSIEQLGSQLVRFAA